MIIKKYYVVFLLINYSEQLFTILPISQFALIRSKLTQIVLNHSCPGSIKLQICEKLQVCEDKEKVVPLLASMMAKHDPHDENLLNLQMVEELANNKMLTGQEIIFFIKKGMAMDPLFNPYLSFAAIDLLVRLGKNKILMGRDILPVLQESIHICGIDDKYAIRVKELVMANIITYVDKEYIVSFLRTAIHEIKKTDEIDEEKSYLIEYRNEMSDLIVMLKRKKILTNNEKDSLFKEINF